MSNSIVIQSNVMQQCLCSLVIENSHVPRAMPVRGLGRHWLWGNRQSEPLNARLINVKPITTQEKFNFPRANANPSPRTGITLGTRLHQRNCTLQFTHTAYIKLFDQFPLFY